MAKLQKQGGQYRQMLLEQRGQRTEEKEPVSYFRIRFYLCLCLFIGYILLDYSQTSVYSVDSSRICAEVSRDMTAELKLEETWAKLLDSITKEVYIQ